MSNVGYDLEEEEEEEEEEEGSYHFEQKTLCFLQLTRTSTVLYDRLPGLTLPSAPHGKVRRRRRAGQNSGAG